MYFYLLYDKIKKNDRSTIARNMEYFRDKTTGYLAQAIVLLIGIWFFEGISFLILSIALIIMIYLTSSCYIKSCKCPKCRKVNLYSETRGVCPNCSMDFNQERRNYDN